MAVDVVIEDERWRDHGFEAVCARAIDATLVHLGLAPETWEVAVLGCDDTRISELNRTFRAKPTATNVLSWPSAERAAEQDGARPLDPVGDEELGDVAIAFDTCLGEAQSGNIPFEHHFTHLLVHGTLHLLGYDHERDGDADLMESTETEILCKLGVPDPYCGNGTHRLTDFGKD